jgi:hypothetical protein
MIPQVDIVVSVLGALSHGRNLPSDSDNFQTSFEFDGRVAKTLMLMSLMTYSSQCDAKYYVWRQCTQAPSWLIMLILLLFGTSVTFATFLGIFFYLRPRSTEIGSAKGKYLSSRYPMSSWDWYKEWCRQAQQHTTESRFSDSMPQPWSPTPILDAKDNFVLCISQQDGNQAIRFEVEHKAVARDPLLPLS